MITLLQVKSWFANKRNRGTHKGTLSKFRKDKIRKAEGNLIRKSQNSPDSTVIDRRTSTPDEGVNISHQREPLLTIQNLVPAKPSTSDIPTNQQNVTLVPTQQTRSPSHQMTAPEQPQQKHSPRVMPIPQFPSSTYIRPVGMFPQPLPSQLLPVSPLVLSGKFFMS